MISSQYATSWHETQNNQISQSLSLIDAVYNNSSPLRRIWGLCDSTLMHKHILNVNILKKKNDSFRLLDLGCGTGHLIQILSSFYDRAIFIGIDSNKESIEQAIESSRNSGNCQFVCAKYDYCKQLSPFDIVICSEVFEHVPNYNDLLDCLEMVLQKGGYLSISTPSGWMFRIPRRSTFAGVLRSPSNYIKHYLFPENNWEEAVKMHPAIQPWKLIKMLKTRNFKILTRQSSLFLLREDGIIYRYLKLLEKRNHLKPATFLYHLINMLESLMNIFPIFRIFESRFILLMEKNKQ